MTERKKALVTGATGVVGGNLLLYLSGLDDWDVIGLSRRTPDIAGTIEHISVDLLDGADCQNKLKSLTEVTHIFHAAYIERPSLAEMVVPNLTMLKNVVDCLEPIASNLKHIQIIQGTKYYGSHLGPFTAAISALLKHRQRRAILATYPLIFTSIKKIS
jgi:nucleoside-diphosphate-sugar epimerase